MSTDDEFEGARIYRLFGLDDNGEPDDDELLDDWIDQLDEDDP